MNDRQLVRAAEVQAAHGHAERIGTPQGLRNLFPTNFVRTRAKKINATTAEGVNMTTAKKPTAHSSHKGSPQDPGEGKPVRTDDDGTANAPAPAQTAAQGSSVQGEPQQPRGPGVHNPDGVGRTHDYGPAPVVPEYVGPMPASTAVDMLAIAALAHDRDAVQAVNVRGEVPAVGQYKASLLEWLDAMDSWNVNRQMPRGDGVNPFDHDNEGEGDLLRPTSNDEEHKP